METVVTNLFYSEPEIWWKSGGRLQRRSLLNCKPNCKQAVGFAGLLPLLVARVTFVIRVVPRERTSRPLLGMRGIYFGGVFIGLK
ncbi:MAG TPA: hypothetical protein DCP36_12315 [Sporomusaceae bacterium]|nr:hypothetical protein [Sporomusaceae bacterium]